LVASAEREQCWPGEQEQDPENIQAPPVGLVMGREECPDDLWDPDLQRQADVEPPGRPGATRSAEARPKPWRAEVSFVRTEAPRRGGSIAADPRRPWMGRLPLLV
jgi:hypothetical protein